MTVATGVRQGAGPLSFQVCVPVLSCQSELVKRTKFLLPEASTVRRAAPLSMRKIDKAKLDGYLFHGDGFQPSPPTPPSITAAMKHRKQPVSQICSFQSNIHSFVLFCFVLFGVRRETKFQIYQKDLRVSSTMQPFCYNKYLGDSWASMGRKPGEGWNSYSEGQTEVQDC